MDPVLLVGIISGSSAILASVGAQIISAILTSRRESSKLAWEQSKSLYQEMKVTFTKFIKAAQAQRWLLTDTHYGTRQFTVDSFDQETQTNLEEIHDSLATITLVAPWVLSPAVEVVSAFAGIDDHGSLPKFSEERWETAATVVDQRLEHLLDAMRRSMNLAAGPWVSYSAQRRTK